MKLTRLILLLAFAACGIAFVALNTESVTIDLYFHAYTLSLGLSLLLTLFIGAVLGGLAVALGSLPATRRRVLAAREQARVEAETELLGQPTVPSPSEPRSTAVSESGRA